MLSLSLLFVSNKIYHLLGQQEQIYPERIHLDFASKVVRPQLEGVATEIFQMVVHSKDTSVQKECWENVSVEGARVTHWADSSRMPYVLVK